ncbi:MAG: vWA domain-containing protein [Nannocystaceae bacterium]
MNTTAHRPRFWSKWPLTTACGLAGVLSLTVLMLGGSATPSVDQVAVADATEVEEAPGVEEDAPLPEPSSASKSGLYAMKGPKEVAPVDPGSVDEARSAGVLGAMADADDADVWGGLAGTEVGEAYGVGGLGLVGTGRGGGGTGEGTIGLGSTGLVGKGGGGGSGSGYGRGASAGFGGHADAKSSRRSRPLGESYDRAIQSRILTVGVVDDNSDAAGYRKALDKLSSARARMDVPKDMWTMKAPAPRHAAHPGTLDVALVIDTTGSMGDELDYLKVEVRDIAREIEAEFPGVDQRWGLVVYKDHGDDYVTREVDFQGIDAFVDSLGKYSAGGGGDYPEAMDEALQRSAQLSWRGGDEAARMVFLVADAPAHEGGATRRYASAVMDHRKANTAIYSVAGSGVQDEAEAQMRLAAKVTGGQYIFLTDHSGVGGHHAAPKVDQFEVESLHDAMARMIRSELGGDGSKRKKAPVAETEPVKPLVPTAPPAPIEPVVAPTPPAAPAPVVVVVAPAEAAPEAGLWDELKSRLATHFIFVASIAMMMLAAMGADSLLRRRRQP